MAAIDKLYVTSEQWREMKDWVESIPDDVSLHTYLGEGRHLEHLGDYFEKDAPIWNIGGRRKQIEWLRDNCPAEYWWVHEDLKDRD